MPGLSQIFPCEPRRCALGIVKALDFSSPLSALSSQVIYTLPIRCGCVQMSAKKESVVLQMGRAQMLQRKMESDRKEDLLAASCSVAAHSMGIGQPPKSRRAAYVRLNRLQQGPVSLAQSASAMLIAQPVTDQIISAACADGKLSRPHTCPLSPALSGAVAARTLCARPLPFPSLPSLPAFFPLPNFGAASTPSAPVSSRAPAPWALPVPTPFHAPGAYVAPVSPWHL